MASAVTLSNASPGDLIDVKGLISGDVVIEARRTKFKRTSFFGVHGESEITGGRSGRAIHVPVAIFDIDNTDFDTERKLADYIDYELGTDALQLNGDLRIGDDDEAGHSLFANCTFDGVEFEPGHSIKLDHAGTMGGGYTAFCVLHFYQLTDGAAEPPPGP